MKIAISWASYSIILWYFVVVYVIKQVFTVLKYAVFISLSIRGCILALASKNEIPTTDGLSDNQANF